MKPSLRFFIMVLIAALALLAAFFIGRNTGGGKTDTTIVENYSFVRTIAQLATYEANGNATITTTNIRDDGSFLDGINKLLGEKTATVSVPYQAKYGVDLEAKEFKIERQDSIIVIRLPNPQLLSYELRLDRMQASSRKGLFIPQNDNFYIEAQKTLYDKSRQQLVGNQRFIEASKSKLDSVLRQYYAPTGYHVVTEYSSRPDILAPSAE